MLFPMSLASGRLICSSKSGPSIRKPLNLTWCMYRLGYMRDVDSKIHDLSSSALRFLKLLGSEMAPIGRGLPSPYPVQKPIFQPAMAWMARCYGEICGSLAYHGIGPFESTPPHVPETGNPVICVQTHQEVELFWCYLPGIMLQLGRTHKASPEKRPSWSISRSGLSASTADLDLPSGMDCGSSNRGCSSRYSDFARVLLQPAVLRLRKHSYLDSGGTALAWKIQNAKKETLRYDSQAATGSATDLETPRA